MQRLDLAGVWQLTGRDGKKPVPAPVPGDIHSALLAAGKIPDPYWGANELDLQWIGREDWRLTRTFEVDRALLGHASVILNCDGLDTITEILINGKEAGRTENMFRRYRFEVKPLLRRGRNEITIIVRSAENAAIAAAKALPYPIPFGENIVQSPHRNLIRKVQCHSGWDWGICLMVGGVCGDLYLGATSAGRIEHVTTTQKHGKGGCELEVTCEVVAPTGGRTELEVACGSATVKSPAELQPGLNTLTTTLLIRNPRLWWPAGYGEQHLYDLTVRVAGDDVRKRIGLRTLEVVTEEDKVGLSMYFKVNGIKVFCKGADWIPCDALPARQTRARYDDLLSSTVAANMNMLRVWGGGQYERDDFYDLCDEKGILIWHDFMFSCALYPATPEFLENVRQEAEYQVKRLRDHASLALWCGNNEDVGALNWFKESRANRDRYLIDYDRLNEGVLGAAVDRFDPTRVFWPSSPCGGRGDYSDCWHKDNRGDMHYWKVWHEGAHFEAYYDVIPRFCSEFGYQSFPSLDTVKSYAPSEQFNVTAPILEHHQRNRAGNSKIIEMFSRYFRMPEGFENFLYLSQVQQGIAIKMAVEFWRHLQPTCMGTLYWQLNDNWPVCSWASLEYSGKWKLLHYMAKRFYAPQLLTAFQARDGKLQIWVVNDEPRERPCRVTWRVLEYGGRELRTASLKVTAPATGALCVLETTVDKLIADRAAGFMTLKLETGGTTAFNEHFFAPWKQCELPTPRVRTSQRRQGDGVAVTLQTDKPAFFVSLNADGIAGEFDDNCFALLPGEPRTVLFTPKQALTAKPFTAALSVRHLRDTYR